MFEGLFREEKRKGSSLLLAEVPLERIAVYKNDRFGWEALRKPHYVCLRSS